jgi:hypothetical protein
VHFCTRDLNLIHAESGLGVSFIFHPRVHPKLEKNLETRKKPKNLGKNSKLERNKKNPKEPKNPWKKLETLKKQKKTQKKSETPRKKPIYKIRRAPEPT